MSEYIEREKVYEMLHSIGGCGAEHDSWADGWDKAIDTAIRELENIPAADVVSAIHGEWVYGEDDIHCSECGYEIMSPMPNAISLCCPRCGAKMDGKAGGENV